MESPKDLIAAQNEVQAQIGRNLLNYQSIEILLKVIVKYSTHEIRKNSDGEFYSNHTKTERMMLGLLFGKYVSDIATLTGSENDSDLDDAISIQNETSIKFKFTQDYLHPDKLTKLKSNTKQLTDDRNQLVHHFREVYSLESVESCQQALKHLNNRNAFSVEQLEYFKQIAIELDHARTALSIVMSSDDVKEFITNGQPDSNPESLH